MKISIITITFNSEKTLEETIQSVIAQDYPDLEYIVVDGGSTDGTLNLIKKYETSITKWVSEPDKGISDAFNKGIKMATGDLIGIINSDDLLAENSLNIISDNIEESADVVYGNAIMFGNGEAPYRMRPYSDLRAMYSCMAVIHPATFVRKSAYDKYGLFDLSYKCCMDRELLLRMQSNGAKFQYIDADLARMRLGGVNQRTYLDTTIKEGTEISVKYGMNPIKAKVIALKKNVRFRCVSFIRKFSFSDKIRKVVHSKNTELDV